jgi:hypothetical protein
LNLENNRLGDYLVNDLCESIKVNATLKDLNLSANQLSYNSSKKIAKMIEKNKTIQKIDLNWN